MGRPRFSTTRLLLGFLAVFLLIQLVPYGRDHANPQVRQEPQWDHSRTRALVVRACFDCHSNQVRWPWYSHIAPVSWLVQHDVDEARRELNFSEWDLPQKQADEAPEEVAAGEMPLDAYLWLHPPARLTAGERHELIAGLEVTMAVSGFEPEEEADSTEDD